MTEKLCQGCDSLTNTAVCDYLDHKDWEPRKCYGRWTFEGGWERGCAYDELAEDDSTRAFVDKLIVGEAPTPPRYG